MAHDSNRRNGRPPQVRAPRRTNDRGRRHRLSPAFRIGAGERGGRPPAASREWIHGVDALRPDRRLPCALELEGLGGGTAPGNGRRRMVPFPRPDTAAEADGYGRGGEMAWTVPDPLHR